MDVISELLGASRARGAMFCQSIASPPWSVRFMVTAPLSLATMVRGEAWLVPARGEARLLRPGDVALVKASEPYVVADAPTTEPRVFVYDDMCDGKVAELGPNTYGLGGTASLMVTGSYHLADELCGRLLRVLPDSLVVPGDDVRLAPALELVRSEIEGTEPGGQVVLDRLLDILLVRVVRAWFSHPDTTTPAWYAAMSDPLVGPVLRMMHDEPGRGWTVASLAAAAGLSRPAFARRFTALVGQPPLGYLTQWRMELAAQMLSEGEQVAVAARRVGYADAFGFSAAFKRVRGMPPSAVCARW